MISLINARRLKNLSREEAAKKFDVSIWSLINYETGKTDPPNCVVKKMLLEYNQKYEEVEWPEISNNS